MDYDYAKLDKKVEKIVKRVAAYMKGFNESYLYNEIFSAYNYAKAAHEGQFRLSGDPYIIHPVAATEILLDLKPDIYTIQACFLHDVIEDTPRTYDDIKNDFGEEVAFLCKGVTKLSKVRYKGTARDVGSLRKMFIAMAEDLRVIFLKLSDRLHNMQTLKYHPKPEKQEKIALETLNIYSPIADRLGLYQIKNGLDEQCFAILDPQNYKKIKRELAEMKQQRNSFAGKVTEKIKDILDGQVDYYEIDYRVKSIYSIYGKLKKKGLSSISELFDLFGMRIMVNSEADCYKVLGLIHQNWTPLPTRFKDYIALPKPNGYRSLHTSVMGLFAEDRKQPTEIQIKTFEMKEYADIGVAAHFEYKEKGSKMAKDVDWVKELKDLVDSLQDNDFVGSLKVDVFRDRIFVFTPQGDFIDLPAGSTPIDFAYAVHTELGDHITIAKVNHQIHPLDKELQNGDVVEVITDKNKKPSPFWISFVKTVKAKNRIKSFLKKEDQELHVERGRVLLSNYLEKYGLAPLDKENSVLKNMDGNVLTLEARSKLLQQIGDFSIPAAVIFRKILLSNPNNHEYKNILAERKGGAKSETSEEHVQQSAGATRKRLIIGGEVGLDYKLCYCSRRKITNDIVAHINKSGIITIHRRDCKVLEDVNKDRLLPAYIDGEKEDAIIFEFTMIVKNEMGVLRNITEILYSMHIDIDAITTRKIGNLQTEVTTELRIPYHEYLLIDRVVDRVKFGLGEKLLEYKTKILQ